MVLTLKCSDVGDHICAVVYTTSYVRQIWVGAVYYTARTYIGHDDRSSAQLWRSLSYIRGGITKIGYFASWDLPQGVQHVLFWFKVVGAEIWFKVVGAVIWFKVVKVVGTEIWFNVVRREIWYMLVCAEIWLKVVGPEVIFKLNVT